MKTLKTTELRVKNIVQDGNGFEMRVVAIHDDGTVYCDFDGNEGGLWEFDDKNPCYGVELTEEILLERGFKKDETNGTYWIDLQTHYLELNLMPDGCYPTYVQCPELSHESEQRVSLSRIEGLHQIQNLFYSIVGKEINVSF